MLLETLKKLVADPPPAMAFEISEAGIAAARIEARTSIEFRPLKPGTLSVSPLKENVIDEDDFGQAVRSLAGALATRKRKDVALILPDYCSRLIVLDFDSFPSDPKEQLSLIRFRLKRSVPFDVESAAVGYWAQPGPNKKTDVAAAVAPLEILARYEAPFRAAGMNPGFVTTSGLAAFDLAPEGDMPVIVKVAGRTLTVLAQYKGSLKVARCLEIASAGLEEIAAVLAPTFVYVEDNLGARPDKLYLCGLGSRTDEAARYFSDELGVEAEPLRSPLAAPGEYNAGLVGYLQSVAKSN